MANSTVAAMTAASALDGTELWYTVQGGADRKATGAQIKTWTSASPTLVTPNLGTPSAGVLSSCTGYPTSALTGAGTGVLTFLATPTSANLAAALTDETGTGAAVFANTPTLVTPILGTPTSGTLTNCTGLLATGGGTGQSTYTKGDILASPGSNTLNKLAVGTDTFVLTADAASTNGVKWAAGGGGGSLTVGSTAISSGTTLRLLYDNAGTLGETAGITFVGTGQILHAAGTITTSSQPGVSITQTWNDGAVAFSGFKINITNTASASTAKPIDLQVGGNTFFSSSTDGAILVNQRTGAISTSSFVVQYQSSNIFDVVATTAEIRAYGKFSFQNAGTAVNFAGGPQLLSNSGFLLEQLNSTNANTHRVFNTTDSNSSPTNFECGVLDWTTSANVFTVGAQKGGTGTLRPVSFVGATFQFAAGGFSANTTVATVLGSLGPAGANTTVQEWFTIKNSGGTTRYIPCF